MDKYLYSNAKLSEVLLKLGLPANSADCYIEVGSDGDLICIRQTQRELDPNFFTLCYSNEKKCYIPIWSVGKLIKIFLECKTNSLGLHFYKIRDFVISDIVELFIKCVRYKFIDFSKLEEV